MVCVVRWLSGDSVSWWVVRARVGGVGSRFNTLKQAECRGVSPEDGRRQPGSAPASSSSWATPLGTGDVQQLEGGRWPDGSLVVDYLCPCWQAR